MLQVHRRPTSRTPSQWCDSALASPGVPAEGPRVWTLRLPPLLRPAQGLVIKGLLQSGSSACAISIFKNVQRFRCLFERLEKPASTRIPHVFDGRRRPRGMKCIANVRDSAGSEEKEQPVPLMPLTLECRVGVGGGQRGGRTLEPGIPGNALSPWARAPAASNPSTAGHLKPSCELATTSRDQLKTRLK